MIPQLLLEEINLGEKEARDYYDKYGKEELEKALAELRQSDEEILAAYPLKDMQEKFEARTSAPAKKIAFAFRPSRTWAMSIAAALAVFLCAPFMYNSMKEKHSGSEIRVKGNSASHSQIRLYKQDGSSVLKLSSGDKAEENDVIQITYVPGNKNYGVIFSLDGNGHITRHFPEDDWTAGKLEKNGEEVPLSFSYKLDNAPEYEWFVFVASKDEFTMEGLKDFAECGKTVKPEYLKDGNHFPKNTEASFFVLKK